MKALDGLRRHFRGWQLAVAAVGTALGGVALALPRPVAPLELPLPEVDRTEQRAAEERARELVRSASAEPLPFLVRAAGETFRRFGTAEATGDAAEAAALAGDFARRVAEARRQHGDRPVLALRAVQADLFTRAVSRRDARELRELGGALFGGAPGQSVEGSFFAPDELGVLFEMRWTKLSGLIGTHPFLPTLNEWRLYYRTLLSNPELSRRASGTGPGDLVATARFVDAVSKRDPDYPRLLALAIVEHWMGSYEAAESLLVGYLVAHPSGPFRLRAQNYMLAARNRLPAAPRP